MKEVALIGTDCQVFSDVLSSLLHRNISVNAIVPTPERVMLDDVDLTVSLLKVDDMDDMIKSLEGYTQAIMVFSDDQTDVEANNFALKNYNPMVHAARKAGVKRLIVVGSPQASFYFMGDLRRQDDIDWVFISTEGDFADRAAEEVTNPQYHHEEYIEK